MATVPHQPYLPAHRNDRDDNKRGWGHTNTISKHRNDRGDRQEWEGGGGGMEERWCKGGDEEGGADQLSFHSVL